MSISAMTKLSEKDRAEIDNRIVQIEGSCQLGALYFMGSGQTIASFIRTQINIIEGILDKNSIAHPTKKTFSWLDSLKKEISSEKQTPKATAVNNECDITGLNLENKEDTK